MHQYEIFLTNVNKKTSLKYSAVIVHKVLSRLDKVFVTF